MSWLAGIAEDIGRHGAVVRVSVVRADGSTPREAGAAMYVSAGTVRDTIGGGALELAAIGHARALLAAGASLSPPPSGHPQAQPLHKGPEGDGERDGVRGSQGLQPIRGGPSRLLGFAPSRRPLAERISLGLPLTLTLCPQAGRGDPGGASMLWLGHVTCATSRLGRPSANVAADMRGCCSRCLARASERNLASLARGCAADRSLLLRPLDGGTPLYMTADRKEHRLEWPLSVTRAVRELLTGARPRAPLLVRGAKGESAWFVEPLARPVHRLYLYGAGHVGRAIVRVLEDLPFAITWIDTSASRFPERIPPHAAAEVARDPAAYAGSATADAFHLVLTYSHALDLAICHSLLRRGDFLFLGLIGSATKRARFLKRLAELGIGGAQLKRLACPIGVPGIGGKEPAMIALSVAAQLVQLAAAAEACLPGLSSDREDAVP